MSRHILITGASGFTGRHACSHFRTAGYKVTAIVNRTFLPKEEADEIVSCNLLDREAVHHLIHQTKPDFILHLAAQNHVGKSWEDPVFTLESNTVSTIYLLDAIRKSSPKSRVLVAGSALQYDPSDISTLPHPYSLSKSLQVLISQAWESLFKTEIMIAKPCNLIGPGNSNGVCSLFAKQIAEMEAGKRAAILEVNSLNSLRDFLDVRDAVRAYGFILEYGTAGEVYDISSGTTMSLADVVNMLQLFSKVPFKVESKSSDPDTEKYQLDPSKICQLGWKSTVPREKTFEALLGFFRVEKEEEET